MQPLDILYVPTRDEPAVVNEQPRAKSVSAEEGDQIVQRARVMHIAVEDFVEQGEAFGLGQTQYLFSAIKKAGVQVLFRSWFNRDRNFVHSWT